jgi:hypothetical protein
VGYAIGSQGLADRCAPSQQLEAGSEYEAQLVADVLDRGWAVALTDYQGLGTPGDHPYVVGRALGRDVLDAMRAARRLPAAGLPAHGPLAVMGYSEGSAGSGWAAQLQPTYAPDLPLEGAAVGGVVGDLEKIGPYVEGGPFAFLLAYTFVGYDSTYPELGLDRFLTARGRAAAQRVRDTCITDGPLVEPFAHESDLATIPLTYPPLVRRLRQNRLGTIAPDTPVLVQHARADNVLPYDQAVTVDRDWCALGVNTRFQDAPGVDHVSGGFGAIGPAIDFLAARFAGTPLPRPAACPARDARVGVRVRVLRRGRGPHGPVVVRVRPVGGTLRAVRLAIRDARGRRLGLSRPRTVRRAVRVRIRTRSRLRAGRRYRLKVLATRPDGGRLRLLARPRMPRR